MTNEAKSNLFVAASMVFITLFAITDAPIFGIVSVLYAVFSVEYGIKQAIDDKEGNEWQTQPTRSTSRYANEY